MACYAALALYPQPQTKSKEIIIKQKPIITDLCDDILGLVQQQVLKNNTRIVYLNEIERNQHERKKYINFIFNYCDGEIGCIDYYFEAETWTEYAGLLTENVGEVEMEKIMKLLE